MSSVALASPEPRLLGIKQAAIYLGCTIWAIRSLIWNKKIPSLKLGNRLLLDKADLDAFVDRYKQEQA
jgi:excisionase family DNA binding protein